MTDGGRVPSPLRTTARGAVANPANRFLAFAAVLTALVAVLAGIAAGFLRFTPVGIRLFVLAPGPSGPATVATRQVTRALLWTVAGLYVLIPVAVAASLLARGDRHWLAPVAWAAVAVLGLPWLGYVALSLATTMPDRPALVALVAGPTLVALALGVAAGRGPEAAPRRPPAAVFLNLAVAAVFLAGVTLGGTVAGPLSGLVEEDSLGAPTAAWAFEYEPTGDGRGVLTVTHDGGDKVAAEYLYVRGSGFADVAGADLTAPGRWQGATTPAGDGGPAGETVEHGDSTTVGVTADCEIRLVYDADRVTQTIGIHDCPERDDASLGMPGRLGGR